MENTDNLRTLASTAYESKSFDQAHQYYTRLLEADPSDAQAWLGKGLSAGWGSVPENAKFDELMVSVKQAFKNGITDDKKNRIADEIIEASKSYINKALREYIDGVSEFDKVPMKEGVIFAIHNMGRMSYHIKNGHAQSGGWIKALDAMEFACDLSPSPERFTETVAAFDFLLNHSRQNTNYLGDQNQAGSRGELLAQQRQRVVSKAKQLDPNFAPKAVSNSGGGCFVATATLGNYDHPYVLELRRYRDEVLLPTAQGRAAVNGYYKLSPPLADFIGKRPLIRALSLRLLIKPAVMLVRRRLR